MGLPISRLLPSKGLSSFHIWGQYMGTPIYGPHHVLSAKNVSSIHIYMGDKYGEVFPIYAFLYRKGRPHLPLFSFSYLGAVSFLNLQFENYFNILDICVVFN